MDKDILLVKQKDAVAKSFREYENSIREGPSLKGADTGIHDMNMMLGGHVPGKLTSIAGRSGHGKAQPLDSLVLTPFGFKRMGDISIGDEVCDEVGGTSFVTGVYDQGIRPVYKLTLDDGTSVMADEDHLWKIYTAKNRKSKCDRFYKNKNNDADVYSIMKTSEMFGQERVYMCKGRENLRNLMLPKLKPVQMIKKDLPIDPYVMGILIGDGCFTKLMVSTNDDEILSSVKYLTGCSVRKTGKYDYRINDIGLRGTIKSQFGSLIGSKEKFIPNDYMNTSIDDRIALLQGLLDSDGYISKDGSNTEYYTSSEQLAKDVMQLVLSLGGSSGVRNIGKKSYVYNGEKRVSLVDSYSVNVNVCGFIPFRLSRKVERFVAKTKYKTPRYIDLIEYVGEMETRCISVSNPSSLYITDNFIVTHNTACTIPMFKASERVVSGKVPAYIFFTWEMAAEEVVGRYISHEALLDWRRIYQIPWMLSKEQHNKIKEIYARAEALPILYQELSTNINKIWDICGSFRDICDRKSNDSGIEHVPVAVIDYVGMAKFDGSKDLRTYRIADFMNGAKGMSKELKQHTIALAQINRSSDDKAMPDRADLSDSQAIEQASDNLIILHRPEYVGNRSINLNGEEVSSQDKVIFRYLKGRSIGTGDRILNCQIKHNRFWSPEHEIDFEYWKMYDDINFWKQQFGQ